MEKSNQVQLNTGKRIPYLDYAKIAITFFVVYGHLISTSAPERPYIYAFHMPFFFLVSGMLHKPKKGFVNGVVEAFLKLFVPALFYMVVYRVYQFVWDWLYIGEDIAFASSTFVSNLWMSAKSIILGDHEHMGNGVCWFLFALFWHKLLTQLWDKNKWVFVISVIAIIGVFAFKYNPLFIGQALKNFPFYLIGFLFTNKIFVLTNNSNVLCEVGGVICLIISGIMTYFNGAVSFLAISMVGNLPLPINVVVCYFNAFIASLGILLLCSQIKKEYKQIRRLAKSLISIVGLQEIFFVSWLNITGGSNSLMLNVTAAIIIMFLCYQLHKVLLLYLPWAVGVIKRRNE